VLTQLHLTNTSYTSTPPVARTACTEPQCLYKGALSLYLLLTIVTSMLSVYSILLLKAMTLVSIAVSLREIKNVYKLAPHH